MQYLSSCIKGDDISKDQTCNSLPSRSYDHWLNLCVFHLKKKQDEHIRTIEHNTLFLGQTSFFTCTYVMPAAEGIKPSALQL